MKATLLRLHSPDVNNLCAWTPEGDFGILVQLIVGPCGEPGEESFDIVLCTPGWLGGEVHRKGVLDGRHHVIVSEYDYAGVEGYLRSRVEAADGKTWDELADSLGRLGRWEFEDYRRSED